MTYDSSYQGKVWGVPVTSLPAMSGALHVKYVNTPMNPNLMVQAIEADPFNGTYDIEQPMGQNYILTSGTTLPANNPGEFFSKNSQQDYTSPRVIPAFSITGSGLPGIEGDAYPSETHNGLGAGQIYPNPNSF